MKSKIYIIMFSCFMLKLGNVGKTVFDTMNQMKILDSLNDSDQLTLF
ncbi:hypothetical protein [Mycoplasmopsis bovis]